MGRPMRINFGDCDVPMPDASDSDKLLRGITVNVREKYIPEGIKDLSQLWVELLDLTVALANVLSVHYRVKSTTASFIEVDRAEQNIRACCRPRDYLKYSSDRVVVLHIYHLELYMESVILTLYRPHLLESGQDNALAASKEWRAVMQQKVQAAAANINSILENLIIADMLGICQAIICIALVPAMQVHLLNMASVKPLVRGMGCHNLDLCIMVANELRKTYFGAEILHKMFSYAQKQILNRGANETERGHQKGSCMSTVEDLTLGQADDGNRGISKEPDTFSLSWYPLASLEDFFSLDDYALSNIGEQRDIG
ncbi:hypothetical protein Plec18167_003766 [Paecilomyces lecythidis]|uniref:Uncharacterized protein n=1 Tax=Paecilomyces lecythidis TaxID=3004212 RepID=A0ABR3XXS8_9EURO